MTTAVDVRPDFLIVGTKKSGTTTLADYLAGHPRIWIPERELHYFDDESNFSRGPAWYGRELEAGCPAEKRGKVLLGEKTPTYSFEEKCAHRIKDFCPQSKLIWIFRDPVQGSFSNYLHAVKNGSELETFSDAIDRELNGQSRPGDNYHDYILRNRYAWQVERFLQLFSREQMYFMLFEDLIASPQEALTGVLAFLGCPPFESLAAPLASNSTSLPMSPRSLWLTRKLFGRGRVFRLVRKMNYYFPSQKPKFPAELRERLSAQFAASNDRLAEITDLDLSTWNRQPRQEKQLSG